MRVVRLQTQETYNSANAILHNYIEAFICKYVLVRRYVCTYIDFLINLNACRDICAEKIPILLNYLTYCRKLAQRVRHRCVHASDLPRATTNRTKVLPAAASGAISTRSVMLCGFATKRCRHVCRPYFTGWSFTISRNGLSTKIKRHGDMCMYALVLGQSLLAQLRQLVHRFELLSAEAWWSGAEGGKSTNPPSYIFTLISLQWTSMLVAQHRR